MRGRENIVPGTGEQGLCLVRERIVRGRENIVLGTGELGLYLVNKRADCAREIEYCTRYRGAEAVSGK